MGNSSRGIGVQPTGYRVNVALERLRHCAERLPAPTVLDEAVRLPIPVFGIFQYPFLGGAGQSSQSLLLTYNSGGVTMQFCRYGRALIKVCRSANLE